LELVFTMRRVELAVTERRLAVARRPVMQGAAELQCFGGLCQGAEVGQARTVRASVGNSVCGYMTPTCTSAAARPRNEIELARKPIGDGVTEGSELVALTRGAGEPQQGRGSCRHDDVAMLAFRATTAHFRFS
jgi:hypothetical protein